MTDRPLPRTAPLMRCRDCGRPARGAFCDGHCERRWQERAAAAMDSFCRACGARTAGARSCSLRCLERALSTATR